MQVTIIGHHEVTDLLSMPECIDLMAQTFRELGRGDAMIPQRTVMWQPDKRGAIGLMPSWLGAPPVLGAKVVSVFPGNTETRYDAHQGVVVLFEAANGCLQAIVDAGAVTAIRTAAVSGLATRLLARQDAGDLAILGAGTQASAHLVAMLAVRSIRRVRVWSRNGERARKFADSASRRHAMPITPTATVRETVIGADLICTVTGATAPILRGEWLAPGAHINAVGASVPSFRELDTATVARSRVFVDRRESALAEADDIRIPLHEQAIDENHILGTLADLALERVGGRTSDDDITLFKSVGLAIEDLAVVRHVYDRAKSAGTGTLVDFVAERY